jgi:hypothetical protein
VYAGALLTAHFSHLITDLKPLQYNYDCNYVSNTYLGGTPSFKEVHLTAMGAAIPHAVLLATSLPPILPFDSREVETIVTTGTTTVMDEVQPVYDDEEGKMETRDKSTIMIVIRIVEGKEDRVST